MSSLKSRKRTERITNALCFIALIFLTCLCMLPIWWIFRSSLMSNAELFKWPPAFLPPRWLFSNYANTLEYFKFWTYLKNTMIIIVPSVIFGTITATMCGYAFARLRFRLRNFLFTLCVGSMLLPTMVTLIPLYIMWTKFFNMSNTFWPLILPYLCGGVMVVNYLAGEGVTHLDEGRPLVLRRPDSRFTLANFLRAQLYSTMATLKIGMDLLASEQVAIDSLTGHGGLFKTPGVGQKYMAAACGAPVTVMESAGEGGPYGMALLAAFVLQGGGETLENFLARHVFADAVRTTLQPDPADVEGFRTFLNQYKACLRVEQAATENL